MRSAEQTAARLDHIEARLATLEAQQAPIVVRPGERLILRLPAETSHEQARVFIEQISKAGLSDALVIGGGIQVAIDASENGS